MAKELGNTPAVALRAYIPPEIWDRWTLHEFADKIKKEESDNDLIQEFVDTTFYPDFDQAEMAIQRDDDDESDDYDEAYPEDNDDEFDNVLPG